MAGGTFLVMTDTACEALDVASGAVLSMRPLPGPIAGFGRNVLIFRDAVTGAYGALDLDSWAVLWRRDLVHEMQTLYGVSVVDGLSFTEASRPDLFILTNGPGPQGFVAGCCVHDGRIRWKSDVTVPYYAPLAARGKIPILGDNRRFIILDEETGRILHESSPDIGMVFHQQKGSLFADRVVFTSESGHVLMFDLESGILLWHDQFASSFQGSVVVDDRLLVPASDGKLWVFEGTNEPQRKQVKPTPAWMKRYLPRVPDQS